VTEKHIEIQIVGDGDRIARECKRFADYMAARADRHYRERYRTLRLGRLRITWKKRTA
jgi:hypothetical protein